ncbi:hypothetical protein HQ560_07955, partial [bacterium]|nr:hypothetical protein [bacterium]
MARRLTALLLAVACGAHAAAPIEFPLGRTAYIIGETIPLGIRASGDVKLEAVDESGERTPLYAGKAGPLVLHTMALAPMRYALHLNGTDTGVAFSLIHPARRSAGALVDEAIPSGPRLTREQRQDPAQFAALMAKWREDVVRTLRETGIDAAFDMCAAERLRPEMLDIFARTGAMMFTNPYTRPMSFNPARIYKPELATFRQRLALLAQANSRYPTFGGFCFDFDPTGFLGRKMLLFYWGWGKQEPALRAYIERSDKAVTEEFTRRTGLEPVSLQEYVTYCLSIGRPDFAPAIDLPTARWLEEMAKHMKPVSAEKLAALEKRIDAWAGYLMGIYAESYQGHLDTLRPIAPSMRHTSTVNLDHCPVRQGQYAPAAYRPLDFRYMTAWNDQVAGPDYAYQWLLSGAMLNTNRRGERAWLAHSLGMVHGKSPYPGKLVRAIAHGLPHGVSGAGFALEGFSNVLGGMNKHTQWANLKGAAAAEGLRAGRDFLDRFAFLATACRGDHGVGILYSRSQMARQHTSEGFGTPAYKALVTLTRLGYTPRFVTEEEIVERGVGGVKALVVAGQTFPLPERVVTAIETFAAKGGRLVVDDSTTVKLAGAKPLGVSLSLREGGKPHNWACPNLPKGKRHIDLAERWHRELAPAMLKALGDTGRTLLVAKKGADSRVTMMQIDGGRDVAYLVAVNDSTAQSHTDWFQVRETLVPLKGAKGVVYDLNQEKRIGPLAPTECDLTRTTARVLAVLPRPAGRLDVRRLPGQASIQVQALDEEGKRLEGSLPVHVAITSPKGVRVHDSYHSTNRKGVLGLPLPAALGQWQVTVRSQLTGEAVSFPMIVPRGHRVPPPAMPLAEKVIVRRGERITALLKQKDARWLLPIFDTPHAGAVRPVAEGASRQLGVPVDVREKPGLSTYWLAYDPTKEQLAENAKADRGETIGKIKTTTTNRNDYYSTLGGYRVERPVLLLDLASVADNAMAEHLDATGLLWPRASDAFPGPGGAVVHLVEQAFGPTSPAIVVQATDAEGLRAGLAALANPPTDWLGQSVAGARGSLLGGLGILSS